MAGDESPQAALRTFELRIAQRLALERFSGRRTARRSQYPLGALMVGYIMVSLRILAQPIVETGPGSVK